MGHILNLIAGEYLYGQDSASFVAEMDEAAVAERRQLWRQRGEVGKLHNLVAHIRASGKRTEAFEGLQHDNNEGKATGKIWKLVLDGGIRWNSTYLMIRRALELQKAIDAYQVNLRGGDPLDEETFREDGLNPREWKTLEVIRDQLSKLFYATKSLEGNANLKEGARKASNGALWETLIVFDDILAHFEGLQQQAARGDFNERIQSSITLAWRKCSEYYEKTDKSAAWVAALVLHPRWKWAYLEGEWTGAQRAFLAPAKAKLRGLWEDRYKGEVLARIAERSPEPVSQESFLEEIYNRRAPAIAARPAPRASARRDELALYLEEPPVDHIPLMEYWKTREHDWPNLAKMAFDFMAIPAMSSECERVFSSCGMQTSAQSSRLTGKLLWHQECLKNWHRRGAIDIGRFREGILLE